jgi:hypothetical protein
LSRGLVFVYKTQAERAVGREIGHGLVQLTVVDANSP